VGVVFQTRPAAAAVIPLFLKGKVTMKDGSPPPFTAGIEQICSGSNGIPGPVTNKQGEYLWRLTLDTMSNRSCSIRATHEGYVSTSVDISSLNPTNNEILVMDTLILRPEKADPYLVIFSDRGLPSKAKAQWKAAMDALRARNQDEAAVQFKAVVVAAPKFAIGWHALGVYHENHRNLAEARDAYERAIAEDPKWLAPYVTLAGVLVTTKDWQAAEKIVGDLIKADSKKVYPEAYVLQAAARFGSNDLDGAMVSANEAIKRQVDRGEYLLGRILEAQGDQAGAREHISKYLDMDKEALDARKIRAYLDVIGKPEAAGKEPDLLSPRF
jgi:tetratricopeptide (TPR) repeat protein